MSQRDVDFQTSNWLDVLDEQDMNRTTLSGHGFRGAFVGFCAVCVVGSLFILATIHGTAV